MSTSQLSNFDFLAAAFNCLLSRMLDCMHPITKHKGLLLRRGRTRACSRMPLTALTEFRCRLALATALGAGLLLSDRLFRQAAWR